MEEIIEKKEKKGKKNGKKIIRIILAVLVTALIVAFFAIVRPFSWKYDFKTRELTVTGTGALNNWFIRNVLEPEYVTIEDGIRIIPRSAFWGCYTLTSIEIPDSVTSIGDAAFQCCSSLTSIEIPDSVTSIGSCAFDSCSSLTSIEIPDSVASIEGSAFGGCSSLKRIKVDENNTLYDSRNNCNAIIETSTNTLIQGCENTVIPDSVTSIDSQAFSGCTEITMPCSSKLDEGQFSDVTYLEKVTITKGTGIMTDYDAGESPFYFNSSIKTVVIENGVKNIGECAFLDCSSLTSITIPDSVTDIGVLAFSDCEKLTDIYFEGSEAQWNSLIGYGDRYHASITTVHFGK